MHIIYMKYVGMYVAWCGREMIVRMTRWVLNGGRLKGRAIFRFVTFVA